MRRRTVLLLIGMALVLIPRIQAHEDGFPEKTLKAVFPDATGFTARKKTFTAEQVKRIEAAAASKLERNDNPMNFYVALGKPADGSGMLGVVVLVDARGPKGRMDLALGTGRDGKIVRIVVAENTDEAALSTPAFLDQFKGKNAQSPLALGKDIRYSGDPKAAEAFLSAVRRGLQMLAVAGSN